MKPAIVDISHNLAVIRERICTAALNSGRKSADIALVAVSKTRSAEEVCQAVKAGQNLFGENRIQEALPKMVAVRELCEPPQWQLVGLLQRNKVRFTDPFQLLLLHSISLAEALQKQAQKNLRSCAVLIQTNFSQSDSKSGVRSVAELDRLVTYLQQCPNVQLQGLMTIPPPRLNETDTRKIFAQLRETLQQLQTQLPQPHQCCHLSMGMSGDFEWAIAEGSTIVRVGSAIFGHRKI